MTSHVSQQRMDRRPLGARSGLEVSEVGLGLWAVSGSEWGPVQDEENLEAIDAALEAGVNFFDTADVYGGGHSEELLGRAMIACEGERHDIPFDRRS
jgi:aryl-alcohol dehydrogenase-like predicted oxidoreductase